MSYQTPIPPGDHPDQTVFSIPAALFQACPDRRVILRTADPAAARTLLGSAVPSRVLFLQVTDLTADLGPLVHWAEGLAIDLLMADPATQLPLLYRCTGLLDRHPVRVTIALLPGVARAVKLAVSLGFAVRLAGHQAPPEVVAEAREALAGYLHNPTVAQPVEPFHSLLLAFLHDTSVDLWSLLERDQAEVLILDDQGEAVPDQGPASVTAWREGLVAAGAECRDCPWLAPCGAYFKWPRPDDDCTGVKSLFAELHAAAAELRAGLAAFAASRG